MISAQSIVSQVKTYGAFTHNGVFHADDVLCTAILRLACGLDTVDIIRSRDLSKAGNRFIFDIGGGEFDHHGVEQVCRYGNDAGPYASAGKLWKVLGPFICKSTRLSRLVDDIFIADIDATDCFGPDYDNTMSCVIRSMNPSWDNEDPDAGDNCFHNAVNYMTQALVAIIGSHEKIFAGEALFKEYCSRQRGSDVVVLDRFVPIDMAVAKNGDFLAVAWPDKENKYRCYVKTVSPNLFRKELRGRKENDGLGEMAEGFFFCHPGGHLALVDEDILDTISDWVVEGDILD